MLKILAVRTEIQAGGVVPISREFKLIDLPREVDARIMSADDSISLYKDTVRKMFGDNIIIDKHLFDMDEFIGGMMATGQSVDIVEY